MLNDQVSYNEKIVEDGFAVVYKTGKYTKDKALRHKLNLAQGNAVKNQAGLWLSHKEVMQFLANN